MSHVDALSRQMEYIGSLSIEHELEFRQLQNSKWRDIAPDLEFRDSDKFELIDGLVFRKGDKGARFVVPDSMVTKVIRTHYDEMAHYGVEKTCKGIGDILISFDAEKSEGPRQ